MPTWFLTNGADTFPEGGSGPPTFWTNTGEDIVNALDGEDLVHGGAMNDSLHGNNGDDILHGGVGNDAMTGDADNDELYGEDGDDGELSGGAGNDMVYGGSDNDTLFGDDGSDQVFGEDGNDTIGGFNDQAAAGDHDILSGGNDNDTLITLDLAFVGATASFDGGSGTDTVRSMGNLGGYTFTNVEVLENGYLIRATTAQINQFALITDTYVQSTITDVILTSGGIINFLPKLAAGIKLKVHCNDVFGNTIIGGNDDDQMFVNFNATGGSLNLDGRGGNDNLSGGARNDILQGGAGNDYLYGSSGFDTASYSLAAAGVVVSLANGAAQNTVGAGIDTLEFGSFDALLGSAHSDTLTASNFGSTLTGGGGNDILKGGSANDTLIGGLGTDSLRGGTGNDLYVLENGPDGIIDTAGIDTATSTISRSIAGFGTLDNLTLLNVAAARNGTGNNLGNVISGNNFANTLTGGNGNDVLRGGFGNDALIGGAGIDRLTGGANNDFFVLNAPLSAANRDTVTDFFAPQDTFRLENAVMTKLGAGVHPLNPQFFRAGPAAVDANDYVVYNKAAGNLSYDSNGNLAGGVTLLAVLTNKPVLTAADFAVI